MAENTSIEWCDHTWSPVWGCTEVSKAENGGGGCDNCYARVLAHRFGTGWNGAPMREFGDHHWNEPLHWNRRAAAAGTRPRVFPSMCDPFDKNWPAGVRTRFAELIKQTPNLIWLLLTKRIGNAAAMLAEMFPDGIPDNVWLGATIVNQAEADRDIPKLLAVPARVRFLSMEPLLGPVKLTHLRVNGVVTVDALRGWAAGIGEPRPLNEDLLTGRVYHRETAAGPRLDWVIVGGESGPNARPMHPDWARSLRDQCQAAGVAFTFKQWGEWTELDTGMPQPLVAHFGDPEWHDAAVAHDGFLSLDGHFTDSPDLLHEDVPYRGLLRVGKKAAGRLLDGIEHNGFPEVEVPHG